MRIHIAVFFLLCVLPVIRAAEGPLCFSCDRVDRLESCKTVTRCEKDEQCLVSKFRTNTGGEIVNFQCQKKTTCELLGSFQPFGRREEEIQVCVECCDGDLCQRSTKHCPGGTPSHPQKSKLCYMCDEIPSAETCKHVEFCPDEDDLCYIHHSIADTGDLIKSLGCKKLSSCKVWTTDINQHTHNSGFLCFECCNETACNSNCHSAYEPTTSPLTTPPTIPLPTSPPTSQPTVSTAFLTEAMVSATASTTPSFQTTPPSTPASFRPTVVLQLVSTEAIQGRNQDVVLSCSFSGDPTPLVSWFYREPAGRIYALHTGITTVGASSNLTIIDPKVSDVGTYICQATNNQGSAEASATLTAETSFRPTVVLHLVSTEAVQERNQDVVLSCSFSGDPTPLVFWFYRGPAGRIHALHTGITTVGASSNLTITDPKVSDLGTYICQATNNQGSAEASATLTAETDAKCYQAGTLHKPVPFEEAVDIRTNATCTVEAPYCISVITASGGHHNTFNVYQGCASATACDQSSDRMIPKDEPCFHGIVGWMTYPDVLLCTFCCKGDFCSENFVPDSSTMYKSKTSP